MPAIDGWFTVDAEPHLIGTKCVDSGTYFFPPETTMSRAPGFSESELVETPLSRTGTLWSYTNAGYTPPEPYVPQTDPFVPFCIAAVKLEVEQMVVLGQCPDGVTIDDLEVGMAMELVIDTLDTTDDDDLLIWKWQPVGWTAERTASTTAATSTGAAS